LFKSTDVTLNFGYTNRTFGTFVGTPDFYYVKKHITGRVVASMYSYSKKAASLLNFFAIPETLFNEDLKRIFEEVYLPKFYDLYVNKTNDEELSPLKTKMLLIELVNGTLKQHNLEF